MNNKKQKAQKIRQKLEENDFDLKYEEGDIFAYTKKEIKLCIIYVPKYFDKTNAEKRTVEKITDIKKQIMQEKYYRFVDKGTVCIFDESDIKRKELESDSYVSLKLHSSKFNILPLNKKEGVNVKMRKLKGKEDLTGYYIDPFKSKTEAIQDMFKIISNMQKDSVIKYPAIDSGFRDYLKYNFSKFFSEVEITR